METEQKNTKRPLAISFLAGLLFAAHIFSISVLVLRIELSASEITIKILFSTIGIATGWGLWVGKKWGWYLGSFYVLTKIYMTVLWLWWCIDYFVEKPDIVQAHFGFFAVSLLKQVVPLIALALIYLYLFTNNVRQYFDTTQSRAWKVVVIEGVALGCWALLKSFCS